MQSITIVVSLEFCIDYEDLFSVFCNLKSSQASRHDQQKICHQPSEWPKHTLDVNLDLTWRCKMTIASLFLYSVYLLISDLIFTPASFLVLDVLQLLMLKTLQTQRGDCSSKFLKTLFFLQQSFINSSYSIVSWAKRTRRSWIKCRHMNGHVAESFVLGKTHHLIFSWVSLAIIRRRQLCSILQFSLPIISGSFVKVRAKREDSHLICAKM